MPLLVHLARAVRGWRRLNPGRHPWWAAGVATIALALPLAATLAVDRPLLAAPATFGALANLYGRSESYGRRWRTQAWTGLGLTLAVVAGALAAIAPLTGWADVVVPAVVVALVAGVAKFVTDAVRTGPPAGLIPVFAVGTLAAEPLRAADLPAVVAVTVTCAALAVGLSAAAGLWRADGPERTAVARALAAVLQESAQADVALHTAWEVLGPRGKEVLRGWLAHAERVRHAGADPRPLTSVLPDLGGRRPLPPAPAGPVPAAVGWRRRQVLTAWRTEPVLRVPALRVGIACAAAILLATTLGFGHASWAAVGAAAALQSPSLGVTTQRALQRGAGTLVGVGVAALLVPLATDDVRLWGLTVVAMFAVEFCMPRNYALGTIAITALSLLLTRLGTSGAPVATLVADRVGDTFVGVLVGVAVAVLVRNRATVTALGHALAAAGAEGDPHVVRGRQLALAQARARHEDDTWRVPEPRRAGPAHRADRGQDGTSDRARP